MSMAGIFASKAIPWKWVAIGAGALVIVAAVFFSIRAYGDARYDAGEDSADAKWRAAAEALKEASDESATLADDKAVLREKDFAEALEEEKEKIDAAVETGDDVFDVMFDTFSVRDGERGD